jgi:trk system potassium uptake protein TrkH
LGAVHRLFMPLPIQYHQLLTLKRVFSWLSLLALTALIAELGFLKATPLTLAFNILYVALSLLAIPVTWQRYHNRQHKPKIKAVILDVLGGGLILYLIAGFLFSPDPDALTHPLSTAHWPKFAAGYTLLRAATEARLTYKRTILNPAQLFIGSFLIMVLGGALLLMLPNATYGGITFLDACFTATSAVCITGLSVIDVGSVLTPLGQLILMGLIQAGALGILTFASYFSYFFKGGTTYESQLMLSDITSAKKLNDVFSTLKYIILITFGLELASALLIYPNLDLQLFRNRGEAIFFAVFHAVSAFCNAGFSTLPSSLYDVSYRYNYGMQLVIIATFVLGGLGFPIVVNLLSYARYRLSNLLSVSLGRPNYRPWMLSLNSRITLVTTLSISGIAFVLFYALEYRDALSEHHGPGKLVAALFGATTPRSAGLNTVDMGALTTPTLLLLLLLMWIGASPQSTGGGIKTSTFAIAVLNILSLAKGKTRIEIFNREIADVSVRRAFAIIFSSLIGVSLGILMLSITDGDKDIKSVVFECFSAYSTTGLSLGITPQLSTAGKLIIMTMMFVGRVSMLSFFIAVFKKVKHKNYRFPEEEITIN